MHFLSLPQLHNASQRLLVDALYIATTTQRYVLPKRRDAIPCQARAQMHYALPRLRLTSKRWAEAQLDQTMHCRGDSSIRYAGIAATERGYALPPLHWAVHCYHLDTPCPAWATPRNTTPSNSRTAHCRGVELGATSPQPLRLLQGVLELPVDPAVPPLPNARHRAVVEERAELILGQVELRRVEADDVAVKRGALGYLL